MTMSRTIPPDTPAGGAAPVALVPDAARVPPPVCTPQTPPSHGDAGAHAAPTAILQTPHLLAATAIAAPANALEHARSFAAPLLAAETLPSGENTLAHADAVAAILRSLGGSSAMQAANYLVYASMYLNRPHEVLTKAFGENFATLATETVRLIDIQSQARGAAQQASATQTETVRKMLLGFSRDVRVVLLRLASRLQTLRWYAASKTRPAPGLARESLHVFAPLANRLGIWQIKWELEDLAFRFLDPETYHATARLLDEKRAERELYMARLRERIEDGLRRAGIRATVQGRPKHIYSIVKKMRGKRLDFDQLFDIRALRVIVSEVKDCYAVLSWVHEQFAPIESEFDDYIARPKPNGYQSLHTVVRDEEGRATEIQIRTQAMHEHAEHGVAAHWAYKEAGTKGYAGVSANSTYDAKIAVLRQLLDWGRDLASTDTDADADGLGGEGSSSAIRLFDDRIYVLTPKAAVVELPRGATPVDFAYHVHTSLGHRCRGAKVNGAIVALNTALHSGQTVDIVTAREERPSRDWLNAELGYLTSARSRAKVRAWFNARATQETVNRGREAVERLLQREGRTALRLEELAAQLGFKSADALFEVVGRDEYSLRNIEAILRPAPTPAQGSSSGSADTDGLFVRRARSTPQTGRGGVLVVGVDSLMTQLARCCKPAPPDEIVGFVTRGKGVSVHRASCNALRHLCAQAPERLIDVAWDTEAPPRRGSSPARTALYCVDVAVDASDRPGLLRDVLDVFARERTHVVSAQTFARQGSVRMTFTLETTSIQSLGKLLGSVCVIPGVRSARRK